MSELVEVQAEPQSSGNMVAMMERMALNPNVDVAKLEKLYELAERVNSRTAETAYMAAMSKMQVELPSVGERGNAAGRYTYALWEDINAAIKPVLNRHGFALSFRTDFTSGIAITAVLSHASGHSERTSMVLAADASGNKNAVQAVASAVSYGKRYTAGALLNLTSHGEDDDAFCVAKPMVSEDQAATLEALIQDVGANKAQFLKYLKVESIEKIPEAAYASAVSALNAKRKVKK